MTLSSHKRPKPVEEKITQWKKLVAIPWERRTAQDQEAIQDLSVWFSERAEVECSQCLQLYYMDGCENFAETPTVPDRAPVCYTCTLESRLRQVQALAESRTYESAFPVYERLDEILEGLDL